MTRTRTLTLRRVPDATLERLRARAAAHRRSLNGELLDILDHAVRGELAPDDASGEGAAVSSAGRVREAAATYAEALSAGATAGDAVTQAEPARAEPDLLEQIDPVAIAAVCRRFHIRWLAVFGSHARGDARPDSDVDVVVDFAPGRTPGFGIVRVAHALRPVFGGRRVDLVTRRGLAPRLRDRVVASARTLYDAGVPAGAEEQSASGARDAAR